MLHSGHVVVLLACQFSILKNISFDVCCGTVVFATNTIGITFEFIETHFNKLNLDDLNCGCECLGV